MVHRFDSSIKVSWLLGVIPAIRKRDSLWSPGTRQANASLASEAPASDWGIASSKDRATSLGPSRYHVDADKRNARRQMGLIPQLTLCMTLPPRRQGPFSQHVSLVLGSARDASTFASAILHADTSAPASMQKGAATAFAFLAEAAAPVLSRSATPSLDSIHDRNINNNNISDVETGARGVSLFSAHRLQGSVAHR